MSNHVVQTIRDKSIVALLQVNIKCPERGFIMMSLDAIHQLADEKALQAAKENREPYEAIRDRDGMVLKCPNIGSYEPSGFTEIDRLFVDKSGFGSPGEPALTPEQFLGKVKAGLYYAIVQEGQFQLYIGVFERDQ